MTGPDNKPPPQNAKPPSALTILIEVTVFVAVILLGVRAWAIAKEPGGACLIETQPSNPGRRIPELHHAPELQLAQLCHPDRHGERL